MAISNEFTEKYGLATLQQYRENMVEGETEAMYYQQILAVTDHIPLKIFESFIEDMAAASIVESIGVIVNFFKNIKVTYADELEARKTAREEINKLQERTGE